MLKDLLPFGIFYLLDRFKMVGAVYLNDKLEGYAIKVYNVAVQQLLPVEGIAGGGRP